MDILRLKEIQKEINRFKKVVDEAIKEANKPSMRWSYDEQKHIKISHTDISGTKLSGAVKRKYIDMKYEINKLINN